MDGSTCHSKMALHHGAHSLALVLTVETDFGYNIYDLFVAVDSD